MARLCFDYGHGGNDPGACYKGRKELNDVFDIGREIAAEVRRHGVIVDETRTEDVTTSLEERSNFENRNNYDYFIAFHRNAYSPEKATGAETYIYLNPGQAAKAMGEKIQTSMVGLGFVNRGVKTKDLHVLRNTKAPAVLIEMGFIDNTKDNNLFDSKRREIIKAISKAILSQLGITYKEEVSNPEVISTTLYRAMAGSYSLRSNAEKQIEKLKAAGFDATIMVVNR
ncbi:N-acetylmuramoyl-L-alanine amidase [Clostridium sp.]|uniref:N-acetylmuramoyl-L-alanine amidase n=1 Tax=Clostridium sp. TaxID=1506 RepID=UPI003216BDD0